MTTFRGTAALPKGALLLGLTIGLLPTSAVLAQDGLTEITVALGWLRNGQYSAVMVADAQGYFAEEGLSLLLIDGGPGRNPVPAVGVGQADFGIYGAAQMVFARVAPDPVDIVAIGVLSQQRPYAYITITDPDAPAPTPADLAGSTVGMQSDGETFLRAIAEYNDIDYDSIGVEVVLATPEPLLVGNIDYFTGMLHNQTYQIEQEIAAAAEGSPLYGKIWQAINFNEFGVPFYHDAVFTSGRTISENPELVESFMTALARGLQFTIDNPDEAAAIVAAYPEQIEDIDKLTWRLAIQNELAVSADTDAHGLLWMDPAIWEQNIAFFFENGEIPRTIEADEVMTNAFNAGIFVE